MHRASCSKLSRTRGILTVRPMDAPVGDKHCHFDRKEAIERDDQGNTVGNLGEGAGIIWKHTLRSEEMNDVTVKWKALNPVQWGLGLLFIAGRISICLARK